MKFTVALSRSKVISIIFVLTLIASSFYAGAQYALAQSGSLTPQTLSGGVVPGAPSYTIFQDAGTYYAKDSHGAIAFTSTNCSYVIQSAYNALSNYRGTITFSGVGPFLITNTIKTAIGVYQVYFTGNGWGNDATRLKWTGSAGGYIFDFAGTFGVVLSNLDMDGNNIGGAINATASALGTSVTLYSCHALRGIPGATADSSLLMNFVGSNLNAELYGCFVEGEVRAANRTNFLHIFGGTIYGVRAYGVPGVNSAELTIQGTTVRYMYIGYTEFYNIQLNGVYFDPTTEPQNLYVGDTGHCRGFSAIDCVFNNKVVIDQAKGWTLYNPKFVGSTATELIITSNSNQGELTLQQEDSAKYANNGAYTHISFLGGLIENTGITSITQNVTWIAHGLSTDVIGGSYNNIKVLLTPSQPSKVWLLDMNATHFKVGSENGWSFALYWEAIYKP